MSLTNFLQKPLARALSGALASIASGGLWAGGTNWHYAQDTFDADGSPNKVLITTAIAQTLGITNAQGGSVGMTVMSQTGVLTTLAVGALPITYDRGATHSRSVWSWDLTQSAYTKTASTIAASYKAAPGGYDAPQLVTATAATNAYMLYGTGFTAATGETITASFVAGYENFQYLWFRLDFPSSAWAAFDLLNGVVANKLDAGAAIQSYGMLPLGNGLYRCWVTWVVVSASGGANVCWQRGTGTTPSGSTVTNTGTEKFHLGSVHVNAGQLLPYLRTFATAPLYTAGTPRSQNLVAYNSVPKTGWSSGGAFNNWNGASANSSGVITSTGTNGCRYIRFPVVGGCVYTIKGTARKITGNAVLYAVFGTSGSAYIGDYTVGSTTSLTDTVLSNAIVAPANAAYMEVVVQVSGATGSTAAFGNFGVWEGTADLPVTPTTGTAISVYPQAGRYDDAVGSTNSIANSSMTGAAAGSPGTMPTGWTGTFTGSGLTQSIAATGTYLGAPYIDIRVQGTSPASQIYPQISFGAAVAASAAQLWTQSCYIGIVAGSLNGILNFFVAPADNNAGQTAKYFQPAVFVDRAQVTHTVAAGATTIQSILGLVTTGSSTAVDVTIRILAPQLEQRSVATPWIPTTNAAATRSPTLIRYPNSYLTDGPQTVTSCVVPASVATQPVLLGKATGASPSSAALYLASGGGAAGCFDGSTAVSTLNAASIGVPNVAAARWSGSTKSVRLNGGAIQSGSYTGTMPGTTVGSGDYGNTGGSNGFTGLRKWDKSAPRTFNDTDFQLAAAGG